MREDIREYFSVLKWVLDSVVATGAEGEILNLDETLETAINMILEASNAEGKLIFIGNGASAAIASHMATDFWKNGRVKAIAFNDASGLTCVSNDFGYRHVFEKPIEMFAEAGDILIAISSSGQSENILLGAEAARRIGARVITLSGFAQKNPLRSMGDINLYVPVDEYGYVEVIHHSLCHCLVDTIIKMKRPLKEKAEIL